MLLSFCNVCLYLFIYPMLSNVCKYMCWFDSAVVFRNVLCVSENFNLFFVLYIAIVLPVIGMCKYVNEQTLVIVEDLGVREYNDQVVFHF